jgi:outer membrane protein OmpA-like peptidoglycan-associated protein
VTGTGSDEKSSSPDSEASKTDDPSPGRKEDGVEGVFRKAFVNFLVWATTGAGFVTLVAATGGAVAWVRLSQAQLPAEEALKTFSRDDFIDIGRVPMGLFGVLGLLAVAIVIAMDPKGQPSSELRRGLCLLIGLGIAVAVLSARGVEVWRTVVALAVDLVVVLLGLLVLSGPGVEPGEGEEFRRWRKFQFDVGSFVRTTEGQLRPRGLWVAALSAAAVCLFYLWIVGRWWVGGSVVVASALAGVSFGIARAASGRFWPYGVAVFLSVALFGAYLGVATNLRDPKMSPIALLRRSADGTMSGMVGLYVVHGKDRTWLGAVTQECANGEFHLRKGSGRLQSIPRAEVVDEAIGSPVSFAHINQRGRDLYAELVRRQADRKAWPATPDNNAITGHACTCATPRLERLVPDHAGPGDRIELNGRAFGGRGTVTLGGKAMALGEWSPRLITAAVARGMRSGPVVVRNACGRRSKAVKLTIATNAAPVANLSVSFSSASHTFRLDSSGSFDPDGGPLTHRIWRIEGRRLEAARDRRVTRVTLPRGGKATVELAVVDESGRVSAPARQRLSTRVEVYSIVGDQTFAFDRDTLTAAGTRRLRQLRDRMARLREQIVQVRIYGYTDYVGSTAYNASLSQRRANRIREVVFDDLGIAARRIRPVEGRGERYARAHRRDDPRRVHDRRVDIRVRLERERRSPN